MNLKLRIVEERWPVQMEQDSSVPREGIVEMAQFIFKWIYFTTHDAYKPSDRSSTECRINVSVVLTLLVKRTLYLASLVSLFSFSPMESGFWSCFETDKTWFASVSQSENLAKRYQLSFDSFSGPLISDSFEFSRLEVRSHNWNRLMAFWSEWHSNYRCFWQCGHRSHCLYRRVSSLASLNSWKLSIK